jgi:hypothetical protein
LPAYNLLHASVDSKLQANASAVQSGGQIFAKRLLEELGAAKERAVMQRTQAANASTGDERMELSEEPTIEAVDEGVVEAVSVQESKKARKVNISFASYDDSDED